MRLQWRMLELNQFKINRKNNQILIKMVVFEGLNSHHLKNIALVFEQESVSWFKPLEFRVTQFKHTSMKGSMLHSAPYKLDDEQEGDVDYTNHTIIHCSPSRDGVKLHKSTPLAISKGPKVPQASHDLATEETTTCGTKIYSSSTGSS